MIARKIVIMSRCQSVVHSEDGYTYSFPMKGALCGKLVKRVNVRVDRYKDIVPGKDYILAVHLLEVSDANILCRLVKYKRIN